MNAMTLDRMTAYGSSAVCVVHRCILSMKDFSASASKSQRPNETARPGIGASMATLIPIFPVSQDCSCRPPGRGCDQAPFMNLVW
ncbi:hypothetical protein HBI56_050220 [Parastagonospora nodorum]|nr:hypothetical protein HBH56_063150 [Parastagonospora nodorum]KAH3930764.1 hypothetical protein HBH54_107090 [Parastagonospora nodorum]KAH3954339.1 hypothetical protein HBH53_022030 [Parastagonospora nodorum]KAH3968210.1 hypothetical protein HBH51_131640 [Parastagonospora nodorum]KAH4000275.1 hypothetical protein HBI10_105530 [Parastagonospora nodorum]